MTEREWENYAFGVEQSKQLKPDVTVANHGSIYLFTPHTDTAREWIETNVSEDRQYFGAGLVVEHRFAHDLAAGMAGDGLVVQ